MGNLRVVILGEKNPEKSINANAKRRQETQVKWLKLHLKNPEDSLLIILCLFFNMKLINNIHGTVFAFVSENLGF